MTSSEGSNQYQGIHTWIEQRAVNNPQAIALVHNEQQCSYQQLNAEANQLARYLRKQGVSSETRVGICTARSPRMVIAILAVLKAGGAYVPIDPDYPQERVAVMMEDARVSVLIADEPATASLFTQYTSVICLAVPQWLDLWQQYAQPHVRLVNTYGPTEATVVTTLCDLAGPKAVALGDSRILPIGKPLSNVTTYILDAELNPVGDGVSGELYIAGSGLARGYLNRPDLTAKSYVYSTFDGVNVRLYKTGDRVRQRADGQMEFLGRVDNQEKIRGFRVELSEVEAVLEQHAHVQQAIVLAREDLPGNKRLVAYVVLDEHIRAAHTLPQLFSGEVPSLRAHLQRKLPGYMVPGSFVLLDALPLSANGKVNRRALPAPTLQRPALAEAYIAPRTDLEKELAQVWSKTLGIVDIGINDNFFELGGNSLQTMALISHIEKKHKVNIPLKDFLAVPSIVGMATLTQQNRADRARPSEHMSLPQMQAEVAACEVSRFQTGGHGLSAHSDIFMTGATGFLGAFLLQALLQQTSSKIYCLVRANNASEAQQKIRTVLGQYFSTAKIDYHRLVPVVGNLMRPNLGMEADQFEAIARSTGAIYHCGANVNMFYPYTALKSANVLGTQAVIRLATTGPLKVLHYISTLDVLESLARMGQDIFYEQDDIAQGEGISGGYAQSKWIAEQLVQQAAAKGLPVCIYRPGMVSGHSQTGQANTNDVLCRFIKSLIQLQAAPEVELNVDMTPVDYVSQAIAQLSLQPSLQPSSPIYERPQVFHIVNAAPITLNEIITTLNASGYPINRLDESRWLNRLYTEPSALSELAAFTASATAEEQRTCLELWLGGHYIFDCANTTQGLAGHAIHCPPANGKLLGTYLNYFSQTGFIASSSVDSSARHMLTSF
ncbi:MAG: thioester reductase domain-containing protein [Phormidesmis sp.]